MPVSRKRFPECPIQRTLAALSGRWKAMVIWHLLTGDKRYSDLARLLPETPQRVLSQALRELEADGIVRRTEDGWGVTPLGDGLRPALSGMFCWAPGTPTLSPSDRGLAEKFLR